VRLVCVRGRHFPGNVVESVDLGNIFAGDQVTVYVDGDLDATVAHLLLNVSGKLCQLGSEESRRVWRMS